MKMFDKKRLANYAIGLIRLETPIDFEQFSNLGTVNLTSSSDQFKMNGCVIEEFSVRYHLNQTTVVLNDLESLIFTSPIVLDKKNKGNPVLCPNISSNQMVQVAVLANTTRRLFKFPKISLHYQWIQQQLASMFNETPNHSFTTHLAIVRFKRGPDEKRCSGSVINRQFVLTAAHCFYSNSGLVVLINITRNNII